MTLDVYMPFFFTGCLCWGSSFFTKWLPTSEGQAEETTLDASKEWCAKKSQDQQLLLLLTWVSWFLEAQPSKHQWLLDELEAGSSHTLASIFCLVALLGKLSLCPSTTSVWGTGRKGNYLGCFRRSGPATYAADPDLCLWIYRSLAF